MSLSSENVTPGATPRAAWRAALAAHLSESGFSAASLVFERSRRGEVVAARRAAILWMAGQGLGATVIGRRLGLDHSTVLYHMAAPVTAAERAEARRRAVRAAAAGGRWPDAATLAALASRFRCRPGTIEKDLRAAGVRPAGRA